MSEHSSGNPVLNLMGEPEALVYGFTWRWVESHRAQWHARSPSVCSVHLIWTTGTWSPCWVWAKCSCTWTSFGDEGVRFRGWIQLSSKQLPGSQDRSKNQRFSCSVRNWRNCKKLKHASKMPGSESRELDLKQSEACDLRQNSPLPCPTPSFLMLVWGHCKALKSKSHFRREDKAHNLVLRWSNGWKWGQRKDGVELLYFYTSESPVSTETWNMCLLLELKHKTKSTPQISLTLQRQALANQVGLQTHWGSTQEDTLKNSKDSSASTSWPLHNEQSW